MAVKSNSASAVYVCREAFAGELDGVPVVCNKDATRIAGDDPLLAVYGAYFERVEDATYEVEQATAAPGEKRNVPSPSHSDKRAPSHSDKRTPSPSHRK